MNLFDLFVTIGVQDEASGKISDIGDKLKSGLTTAGKVAAAGIGAVTTATAALYTGVTAAAGQVASYGDSIDKMSQKMGLSAEAYQEWDAIMQHSGTSIESLQSGMKTLANAVESGNGAFERLGITQEQIASMDQEELFSATISALQNVENETERTYLAGQLLGRGATELGALLNTSAEDTEKMRQRVHELGGVMSDEAVKASAKYQDSLQDMQTAITGLKNNLVSDFLPGMSAVMDGVTSLMAGESGAQEVIAGGISDIIKSMSEAIPQFMEAGGEIVGAVIDAITNNLPQMVQGGADVILSLVDGLVESIDKVIDPTIEAILTIVDTLTEPDSITKLLGASAKIIGAVATGLIRATPELVMKVPEIVGNIVRGFAEAWPDIVEIGKDIVRGLWEGIQSLAGWIGEKVSGFFDRLFEGAKEHEEIHSPSKKWAEIGKYDALGFGAGWDSEFGNVRRGITSGLDFGTAHVGFAESGLGMASAGMINASTGASYGFSGPVELVLKSDDGQTFGRWMVPFMRSENRSNPEVVSDA